MGAFCEKPGCRLDGYAFIPAAYYKQLKETPNPFADPRVGWRLDDYVVLEPLGKGGFSRVYRALQLPIGMTVALKLIAPATKNADLPPELLEERLQIEATALSRITHPNVVRLIDFSANPERPYLVTEYLDGGSTLHEELVDLVEWDESYDEDDAWHILHQVLNAVEATHDKGVAHRDLNPNNIMLQSVVGDRRFVRLFDYGLGKMIGGDDDEHALGTPEYIAPEQLVGEQSGVQSDLYAVGVLTFTLLEWRSPFFGQTRDEILLHKQDASYDPTSAIEAGGLDSEARSIYRKAMAVDPADRYRSAKELRVALNRLR